MYICTVTGKTSTKLVGNEINRGLSDEYLYVDMEQLSPRNRTIISFLLTDLQFCVNHHHYGFGSVHHVDLIARLRDTILHPYKGYHVKD